MKWTLWMIVGRFALICVFGLAYGCDSRFLDPKPSTDIVVPTAFEDLESLLNNNVLGQTVALGHLASDDYVYVDSQAWLSASSTERNSYIWAKDLFEGEQERMDWNRPYVSVFYANNILERLNKLDRDINPLKYDELKGWALFIRAYAFYTLASNFCMFYDAATAPSVLGIPLKLSANIDEVMPRASLQETYDRLLADLNAAAELLPEQVSNVNKMKPSKVAVYAFLSRIYLAINDFEQSERNADLCLGLYNELIDYNTLSPSSSAPFSLTNVETVFSSMQVDRYNATLNHISNTAVTVNPEIITLYSDGDLRPSLYFGENNIGNYYVKTGYLGVGIYPYTGLAIDEVYLNKAECLARRNEPAAAMALLDELLILRYEPGTYIPYVVNSGETALEAILTERRKELVWRGIRWSDIKRLNKLGHNFALRRLLGDKEYVLPPNDSRYVFPIPDDEIYRSGIQQNER